MRLLRLVLAVAALLVMSGCSKSQEAGIEAWVKTRSEITLDRMEKLPATTFGQPNAWRAHVTAKPGVTQDQLTKVIEAWPGVAADGRSELQLNAPQLVFTAISHPDNNLGRWDAVQSLTRDLPDAGVKLIGNDKIKIDAGACDPWAKLGEFDTDKVANSPGNNGFELTCGGPVSGKVTVSKRGIGQLAQPSVKQRVDRTLSEIPGHRAWELTLDATKDHLELFVLGDRIPLTPSQAQVAADHLELVIATDRARARVSQSRDLRRPTLAAAELDWPTEIDGSFQWIEVKGNASHLPELTPVAQQFADQTWMLWTDQIAFRARGGEFGERVRQYQAIRATGIDVGRVTMIDAPASGRPTIQVQPPVDADLIAVAKAVRSAAWRGEMLITIGSASSDGSGAEFRSTATGPAQEPRLPNAPGSDPSSSADSQARVDAWNATAS